MTCDLQLTTFSFKLLLSQCGINRVYIAVESGEHEIALVVMKGASPRVARSTACSQPHDLCPSFAPFVMHQFVVGISSASSAVIAGHLRSCVRSLALKYTWKS